MHIQRMHGVFREVGCDLVDESLILAGAELRGVLDALVTHHVQAGHMYKTVRLPFEKEVLLQKGFNLFAASELAVAHIAVAVGKGGNIIIRENADPCFFLPYAQSMDSIRRDQQKLPFVQ